METRLKKNPALGTPVSYAQIDLKMQTRRKKLTLTTKPALVNRMIVVCINGASICWAAAETDTQSTNFDSSALKKQLLIFQELDLELSKEKKMKKCLPCFLVLLLWGLPAFGEFTPADKATISDMIYAGTKAYEIVFYVGQEIKENGSNPTLKPALVSAGKNCWNVAEEIKEATSWLVGSVPTNRFPNPDKSPENRIAKALHHWQRGAGPYRRGACEAAIQSAIDAGATTDEIQIYAGRNLTSIQRMYEQAVLIGEGDFVDREPPEWPFLVRRASDNEGVHGDFERATNLIAQGMDYLIDSAYHVFSSYEDGTNPTADAYVRNFLIAWKDLMIRVTRIQMMGYKIGITEAQQEPFTRLNDSLELALSNELSANNVQAAQRFGLAKMVREYAGEAEATRHLHDALRRWADGWFKALDVWSWEALRFACINNEGVGCESTRGDPTQ
jgi:hypothetical protein